VRNNATDNADFRNATMGLPTAGGPVTLAPNGTSTGGDGSTTGFGFLGHVVLVTGVDGALTSLFAAEPTDTDQVWALVWDRATDASAVPVSLKDQAPPNLAQ
jgi:hypothetical protein